MRSIAGTVTPMAAVAGKSKRNVVPKATDHCHHGAGAGPVSVSTAPVSGAAMTTSSRHQAPITASARAYQRRGSRLDSMRAPNSKAPAARPAKNAATTASTEADSAPSDSANCCVHRIW